MKKHLIALLALALVGCGQTSSATTNNSSAESTSTLGSVSDSAMENNDNIAIAAQAEDENTNDLADPYEGQYRIEELNIDDNGTNIWGKMYYPLEEKDTYPTVIMSHGIGGNFENCEPYAKMFAANGIAAFSFDFQGGGPASKSDGQMIDMSTLTEAQDLEVITEALKNMDTVDNDNLFLLGESMGGFVSAYVAAYHPEDYAAIVLFYPAFVLQDDAWAKYPNGPEDALEVEEMYGLQISKKHYMDNMSFDIYGVIGGYEKDVLIVHGDSDQVVPLSYSERALEVYKNAKMEVIPGAEHGFRGEDIETAGLYALEFVQEHIAE